MVTYVILRRQDNFNMEPKSSVDAQHLVDGNNFALDPRLSDGRQRESSSGRMLLTEEGEYKRVLRSLRSMKNRATRIRVSAQKFCRHTLERAVLIAQIINELSAALMANP
jgi:hypothetical protein